MSALHIHKTNFAELLESLGSQIQLDFQEANSTITGFKRRLEDQSQESLDYESKIKNLQARVEYLENGGFKGEDQHDEKVKKLEIMRENLRDEFKIMVKDVVHQNLTPLQTKVDNLGVQDFNSRLIDLEGESNTLKADLSTFRNSNKSVSHQIEVMRVQLEKKLGKEALKKLASLEQFRELKQDVIDIAEQVESGQTSQSQNSENLQRQSTLLKDQISKIEQLVINLQSSNSLNTSNSESNSANNTPQRRTQTGPTEKDQARISKAQNDEIMKKFRYLHDNTNSKLDTLRYELDLFKEGLARQKRLSGECIGKLDDMTKQIDMLTTKDGNDPNSMRSSTATNFMNNASSATLKFDEKYGNAAGFFNSKNQYFGQPLQQLANEGQFTDAGELDMDGMNESFMRKNTSENLKRQESNLEGFDVNISVINKLEEGSKMVDESDFDVNFMMGGGTSSMNKNRPPPKDHYQLSAGQTIPTSNMGVKMSPIKASSIEDLETQGSSNQENSPPVKAAKRSSIRGGNNSTMNGSMNTSFRLKKDGIKEELMVSMSRNMQINEEDSELTLQMDENGFLLDRDGYPIIGDDGKPMRLDDEELNYYKENGLYEEEEVETGVDNEGGNLE